MDPPGGDKLRLYFDGHFDGRAVRWNATLFTPAGWAAQWGESRPNKNIIEIGDSTEREIEIKICLKVDRIDHPTVRKAVMMVRQYKKLHRGRHEYG